MRRSLPVVCAIAFAFNAVAQAPSVGVLSALGDIDKLRSLGDARNVEAQASLCHLYRIGRRVPQDYTEAAKWCRRAAEQGDIEAQSSLGALYSMGHGVSRSQREALKWLTPAAGKGHARAQLVLGQVYEYGGHDLAPDKVRAHMWYNIAASNFIGDRKIAAEFLSPDQATIRRELLTLAEQSRARAVQSRARVANTMSAEQIAEAQRLAREWNSRAATIAVQAVSWMGFLRSSLAARVERAPSACSHTPGISEWTSRAVRIAAQAVSWIGFIKS